jgi:adenosylcobyric acid synthase
MNPILLKPTGTLGSQVVVDGRPWRNLTAAEYYHHFEFLQERVMAAYARLAARCDYVVIEGAGSITELNLKSRDLVNLDLAARLGARGLLVADIDRGGVFASVIGTFALLDDGEASLVRAFLINRFRGDRSLFRDGVEILESRTGRPCLGVFPFEPSIQLDAEDSVSLEDSRLNPSSDRRHAIVRFPHISNFTDFRLLPDAIYVTDPVETVFETIFLPGTKSTIEDLAWLRSRGLDEWILRQRRRGARVIGICGGYQMMGEAVMDPDHLESPVAGARGLGIFPASTTMAQEKVTRRVEAVTPAGHRFHAYEIHMGVTTLRGSAQPFATLQDGSSDGIRIENAAGTYLHGALEDPAVLEELLGRPLPSAGERKDASYDRLADWFAAHVDQNLFAREYL